MLPQPEEENEGRGMMRKRTTVVIPVDALDDPSLTPVEIYILAQILRFQSGIDRYTVNGLNQFLNLSKNTIRKGMLRLASSGYLTTLPDNKGWVLNEIKICASEDQNLTSGRSKFDLSEIKICASEREEERTKEEDKELSQNDSIYNINNKGVTENEKEREIPKREKAEDEKPEPDPKPEAKPKVDRYTAEYETIVGYLNEKTGKHYSSTTESTRKHIRARLKEGFTVEDFRTVIDKKCREWKGTDMDKYLRPETLFASKFDRYLNDDERIRRVGPNGWEYTVPDEPDGMDEIFGGRDNG